MTEQEKAIQTLNVMKCQYSHIRKSDSEWEAVNMAIEALEKQIPQKPNVEGDGYADGVLIYDTWICPHCEIRYEIDYDDYAYCPNCGQAIDRSDIPE